MRRPADARIARVGRTRDVGRRVACGAMTIAAVGLVVAVLLGAPLVSILLAGLLLLCPLLIWAPIRYQGRAVDRAFDRPRHGRAPGQVDDAYASSGGSRYGKM